MPVEVCIISKDKELASLLPQHDVLDTTIKFNSYAGISEYKESMPEDDEIVILDCDGVGKGDIKGLKNVILCNWGEKNGLDKPYRIKDLFFLLGEKVAGVVEKGKYIAIGKLKFSYIRQQITDGKSNIDLTEKESDVIKALLDALPKSLSREKLLNLVWGYDKQIDTHTLETHIYRLRKKLNKYGDFIITDKSGYKIDANG